MDNVKHSDNKYSALFGIILIAVGGIALFGNGLLPLFGVENWGLWRFWPLAPLLVGCAFVIAPFASRQRGMAGMFIPGVPILTAALIMLVASIFDYWSIWAWAWSLMLIALGIGFSMAAVGLRVRPLFIPAIIVGVNGLIMLFCSVTGWWESWAFIWTLEPLTVGFALLFTGFLTDQDGMKTAGWILCLIAGGGMVLMTTVLSSISFGIVGSLLMIGLGSGLFVKGFLDNRPNNIDALKMSEKEKLASVESA